MKTPFFLVALALSAIAPAARLASAENPPPPAPAFRAEFVDPDAADMASIRRNGDYAIDWIASLLIREVNNALAKGGPENAVEVCHLKALPTTGAIIASMPQIKAAKRTSFQVRNPANAPDAAEKLALDHVQREIDGSNAPPKILVQRIDREGKIEWRVYRPIGLLPNCVICHGDADSMPSALRATLEIRYPEDKAVGYSAGQWRGLIRVTVAAPPAAPKPPPKS